MSACTPRKRYVRREETRQAKAAVAARWKDSFTPLERWFFRLPSRWLEEKCHCGSGKPLLYWSPDDGTGCEDCRGSLFVYIPEAVMYNIMDKFGITGEVRTRIYEQIEQSRAQRSAE